MTLLGNIRFTLRHTDHSLETVEVDINYFKKLEHASLKDSKIFEQEIVVGVAFIQ